MHMGRNGKQDLSQFMVSSDLCTCSVRDDLFVLGRRFCVCPFPNLFVCIRKLLCQRVACVASFRRLFSITDGIAEDRAPVRLPYFQKRSIYVSPTYGPVFGGGAGIFVCDNANVSTDSYCTCHTRSSCTRTHIFSLCFEKN